MSARTALDTPSPAAVQPALALATAAAAAVFTLVFLGLLIRNGYDHYVVGTAREDRLAERKQQLLAEPENEALVTEIRREDLLVRARKLQHLRFTERAGLLALLSGLIAFGACKWAWRLRGTRPHLRPVPAVSPAQRRRGLSQVLVGVLAGLLTAAAGFAALRVPANFPAVVPVRAGGGESARAVRDWATPDELKANWHRFRGFAGAGVTSLRDIPTSWDGSGDQGILWKAPLGLPGNNSPVVWQDRIFLSGGQDENLEVRCYAAADGRLLWTGTVPATAAKDLEVMEDTGLAANTLATDGRRVYAIFATGDVAGFDLDGKRLWHTFLGTPDSAYGYATSLEVWQNRVLIQYDQAYAEDGKSRLIALAGATGKVLWETKRPVANSWTSPIIAPVAGTYPLITVGAPWVIAYDPNTGAEIWRAEAVDGDVAPSPILAGDRVIAIEPYAQSVAIRADGHGDVTETHILWRNEDAGPDIPSPVADGNTVFIADTVGTLYAVDAATGELRWEHDFEEDIQASPSLVAGTLYVLAVNGTMFLGTPGPEGYTPVAKCSLGEPCLASPAFMPGRIYLRGKQHLFAIGGAGQP